MFDGLFKPIAFVLGQFLNLIFMWMDTIGIGNIGIAIIIFTVIIKTAMFPLTLSQQKTAKISQLIQPEIKAIRAKYRPCPLCGSGRASSGARIYYFPSAGEAYHLSGCSALQRNYVEIDKKDAIERGYTPCSKCGG